MLIVETVVRIRREHAAGKAIKAIARDLRLSRKVVRKASRIKIDRSFIVPLSGDDGTPEAAIVRPIVTMAHYLGLGVIAEGVETPDQVRFLTRLGCEEGQGYYFSRPVSAEAIESLLRQTGPILPAQVAELRDDKR